MLFRTPLYVCLLLSLATVAGAIDWPVGSGDVPYPIGNSYGEFQNYGGDPYYHPGIDILAPAGTPVYAVKAGYVKAVLTISADLHWRVAVGDSAGESECDGWLYAHLDESSIVVNEGDYVEQGQHLGNLVAWPVADFHHLHFVKIRNSGTVWDSNWQFIGNPLDELAILGDTTAPVFEDATPGQKLAYCRNQSDIYFGDGSPLSGDVDIIAYAYDYIDNHTWKVAPYKLDYRIDGDTATGWINSVTFSGTLDYENNIESVYQDDAACNTRANYDYRDFFFNVTNTDGDGIIETSDREKSWRTAVFHNGEYVITVRASDRSGNLSRITDTVTIANYFSLSGTIDFGDGNPDLSGVLVTVLPDGSTTSTDAQGQFSFDQVGGGAQWLSFTKEGYLSEDSILMVDHEQVVDATILPATYLAGDPNFDGVVNIGDAVYIINYIFKDGAYPTPFAAGDTNNDGTISLGDAVYLVNYIFKNGPAPLAL